MRLHELYFTQFEGGAVPLTAEGALAKAMAAQWGSFERGVEMLRNVAMMRGPGWAMLYLDPETGVLHPAFVGEQHQGHLVGLPVVLALDVWEHAFILDYGAAGRAKYVDAFFKNLNWGVVEKRYTNTIK